MSVGFVTSQREEHQDFASGGPGKKPRLFFVANTGQELDDGKRLSGRVRILASLALRPKELEAVPKEKRQREESNTAPCAKKEKRHVSEESLVASSADSKEGSFSQELADFGLMTMQERVLRMDEGDVFFPEAPEEAPEVGGSLSPVNFGPTESKEEN